MRKGNFDGHYVEWRKRRIEVTIDKYGEDFFEGKTILEVGAGWGQTGKVFSDLGAKVTVSDARKEHMVEAKKKFPELECIVVDSESSEWDYPEEKYDIVIHWGLLYHLENPERHLKMIADHCDTLIIETLVSDSRDPDHIKFRKEEQNWTKGAWGMAFSGIGCIPSYRWVERVFKESNLSFERLKDPERCNSGMHKYNWERKNDGGFFPGQRAFWFCKQKWS